MPRTIQVRGSVAGTDLQVSGLHRNGRGMSGFASQDDACEPLEFQIKSSWIINVHRRSLRTSCAHVRQCCARQNSNTFGALNEYLQRTPQHVRTIGVQRLDVRTHMARCYFCLWYVCGGVLPSSARRAIYPQTHGLCILKKYNKPVLLSCQLFDSQRH
jgi:hypothetical protein